MNREMAAIAASEVCRTAEPAEALRSSTNRCNICAPCSLRSAQCDEVESAAHAHANQEAKAEREAHGRERPLNDDVFHRLLEAHGRILRRVQHRRSALGSLVERGIHAGAGLLVTIPRLLLRRAGK